MNNPVKGGALCSPEDKRDYTIAMAMEVADVAIPSHFEVWQPPVENQDKTNNCVAQSIANILECIEHRNDLPHSDFSVGYIYGNRRKPEEVCKGMIPRTALDTLLDDGDVYREAWESNDEIPAIYNELQKAKPSLAAKAKKLVRAYVRLQTKEELQLFMLKYNLPVLILTDSGNLSTDASGTHAIVAYGWCDPKAYWKYDRYAQPERRFAAANADILITNSWGADWGVKGRGGVNYDYVGEKWGLIPVEKIKFTDVPENMWYSDAIGEAVNDGIIMGYPDNIFKPGGTLTRAELAVIWQRMKRYINALQSK